MGGILPSKPKLEAVASSPAPVVAPPPAPTVSSAADIPAEVAKDGSPSNTVRRRGRKSTLISLQGGEKPSIYG